MDAVRERTFRVLEAADLSPRSDPLNREGFVWQMLVEHEHQHNAEVFFGRRYKVLRGGSWATRPQVVRSTFCNWDLPERRQLHAGSAARWTPDRWRTDVWSDSRKTPAWATSRSRRARGPPRTLAGRGPVSVGRRNLRFRRR